MPDIFRFKQFDVDQAGCAMKINTDGVLLGAMVEANKPKTILEIGTGTGVIALMLAQKFGSAKVEAVEIDGPAMLTAGKNFASSHFADRMVLHPLSFQHYFEQNPDKQFDLIISNPPFYIDALNSPHEQVNTAKHADQLFFNDLISAVSRQLHPSGACWLILPLSTSALVKSLAAVYQLHLQKIIAICSFDNARPHREILVFGHQARQNEMQFFSIYNEPKIYSESYKNLLKDFFIAF